VLSVGVGGDEVDEREGVALGRVAHRCGGRWGVVVGVGMGEVVGCG
jgi:hypothetical protein